ncbi:MAG TPA: DNA polymerase, partial [Burkholderiales bacterium]|nr:DNA polymerase [Burkholderiales bacterium]
MLLVDGSSYLYRAFHALPELRSPKTGEPTGAIYGVLNMLRKLANDYKAHAWAAVFDAKGRTFRDDVYPAYKATRSAMPDDLRRQVEPLYEAVKALGWPFLCVDGVEADDVIGTLAEEARKRGWRTVISTGDKDLTQLVDERTLWVNTMSNEKLDVEGVKAKFGVPPERIVDYLTLIGDQIDNIPGVEGVGPGYASKWLQQYGSLDNLLSRVDEIKGTRGDNLRKLTDWLPKARELLTVKRDVPLPFPFEKLTEFKSDPQLQRAQYERYGFKTWLKELEGAPAAEAPAAPAASIQQRRHRTILTEDELRELVLKLAALPASIPLVGFACLGSSEDPMHARLTGIAFAFGDEAAYLPLAHDYPGAPPQVAAALTLLKPWLERADCCKVSEDAKLDSHLLANEGMKLAGCVHDTIIESYVLEVHERHELGSLAQRHCGWTTLTYEEVAGKGASRIPFSSVELARATEYAAQKADCILALHDVMHPRIAGDEKLAYIYQSIELPLVPVLFRMERNGVLLDRAKLEAQSQELGKEILALEQKAFEAAGQPFNLGSPKQIQEILFERQKLPVKKKTPSGQPSTDEDSL